MLISTANGEKQRITFLLGVSASNDLLPIFSILRGKKVPIELRALESVDIFLDANESAWMKVDSFLRWIEHIWAPYSSHFSRTLLIMDRFKVHYNPEVLKKLEELNTDVVFVPRGLTFYTQPCDVYLNGPLKQKMRTYWQAHMASQKDSQGKLFIYISLTIL